MAQALQRRTRTTATGPATSSSGPDAAQQARAAPPTGGLDHTLGSALHLESLGAGVSLPGTARMSPGRNPLRTTAATRASFLLTRRTVEVRFDPPLEVDMTWPLGNVAIRGAVWDLRAGRLADIDTSRSGLPGFDVTAEVEAELALSLTEAFRGTPLERPGYDPFADTDLSGTVTALTRSLRRGARVDNELLAAREVTRPTLTAALRIQDEIVEAHGQDAIRVAPGGRVALEAQLDGTMQDIKDAPLPTVRSVLLRAHDAAIVVEAAGRPVAALRTVTVHHGGVVGVPELELLGGTRDADTLVRGFGAMFQLLAHASSGRGAATARAPTPPGIEPAVRSEIERALTHAVRRILLQRVEPNQSVDLAAMLGLRKGAPTPRSAP